MSIILDREILDGILTQIEQQDKFFKNKACLDTLSYRGRIIGREKQIKELVPHLLSYKKKFVVPLVSVYGGSGSGKSCTVRFVCESLDGISFCIVNLREAKSIFGFENLILRELKQPSMQSAHGMSLAMSKIEETIVSNLISQGKNFFVLVLDEFDQLFCNKRENPSDFVYKLLVLEENLKKRGLMLIIVCISNNALSEYGFESRVRSRIGSSEIFFERYKKSEIFEMLSALAIEAFSDKVDDSVLDRCAHINGVDYGDARRAVDLLRKAAEIAARRGEQLSISHVEEGSDELQNDRIIKIISSATHHFKIVCFGLARLSYLTGEGLHSTSSIYRQYWNLVQAFKKKPLRYRRISEILTEIKEVGIAISDTKSSGRRGWGTRYKLTMPPEMLGNIISKNSWKHVIDNKTKYDKFYKTTSFKQTYTDGNTTYDTLGFVGSWKDFVNGKDPEW